MKGHHVFLGMIEVSGYYRGLKSGFDELGVPCTRVDLGDDPFAYGRSGQPWLARAIRGCFVRRTGLARWNLPARAFYKLVAGILKMALLAWAIWRHDIFIFGYGTSFFSHLELPLLRLLGRKIICQFHGSDSRPPFMDGAVIPDGGQFDAAMCIRQTLRQKRRVDIIDKYAHVVVDTPTQGLFHTRPFVNWLFIGLPVDRGMGVPPMSSSVRSAGTQREETHGRDAHATLRILHCPSHPRAKGTAQIRQAVEILRQEGLPLELLEVTGQPNSVVQARLADCDFVIDQLYADYPMPGLATEAAWQGKPVIICGYAAGLWEKILPPDLWPPTHYVHPGKLLAAIRQLATDAQYRKDLGQRAQRFVQEQWAPVKIARRYLDLADGNIPPQWLCDPAMIDYVHGCCLSEGDLREMVGQVLELGGPGVLHLDDKPQLRDRFVEVSSIVNRQSSIANKKVRPDAL